MNRAANAATAMTIGHSLCERYAEYRKPFDAAAEKRIRDADAECAMNYINSSNHKRLRRMAARSRGG